MLDKHIYEPHTQDLPFKIYELVKPSEETIQGVADQLDIPRDFITSGLDPYEIGRWETYTNSKGEEYVLCVAIFPYTVNAQEKDQHLRNYYQSAPIAIAMKDDLVLITSSRSITELFPSIDTSFLKLDKSPRGVLTTILWEIAHLYIDYLKEMDRLIQELEEDVTKTTNNTIFYKLIGLNKGLVYFKDGIENNQKVLTSLRQQMNKEGSEEIYKSHLRDVMVEHHQALGMAEELYLLNSKVSDILSNVVNNNMNQIMKILTVWSILLTVPTIIRGIWGMNVGLPIQNHPYAFIILKIIIVVIMVVVYRLFKKNHWM